MNRSEKEPIHAVLGGLLLQSALTENISRFFKILLTNPEACSIIKVQVKEDTLAKTLAERGETLVGKPAKIAGKSRGI
jgi:hypothetical protein